MSLTQEQMEVLLDQMDVFSKAHACRKYPKTVSAILKEAITAIRQLQEAQKDAERYRWLRDNCNLIAVQTLEMNSDEDLDAAIDAAIQTKEQG